MKRINEFMNDRNASAYVDQMIRSAQKARKLDGLTGALERHYRRLRANHPGAMAHTALMHSCMHGADIQAAIRDRHYDYDAPLVPVPPLVEGSPEWNRVNPARAAYRASLPK